MLSSVKRKWSRESTCADNRIAVRFACEYHDDSGYWFRAYGNWNWQFAACGLMERRIASISEQPIVEVTACFIGRLVAGPIASPG